MHITKCASFSDGVIIVSSQIFFLLFSDCRQSILYPVINTSGKHNYFSLIFFFVHARRPDHRIHYKHTL